MIRKLLGGKHIELVFVEVVGGVGFEPTTSTV